MPCSGCGLARCGFKTQRIWRTDRTAASEGRLRHPTGRSGIHRWPEAAVAAFHAEAQAGNIAYPFALKALQNDFSELGQDGPTRAAEVYPGSQEERERVRQQVVTVSTRSAGSFSVISRSIAKDRILNETKVMSNEFRLPNKKAVVY